MMDQLRAMLLDWGYLEDQVRVLDGTNQKSGSENKVGVKSSTTAPQQTSEWDPMKQLGSELF